MLLYFISITTTQSGVKSNGKNSKGHSSQQIQVNTLESRLKDPVRSTPLICSNFKFIIFANDPVLDFSSDLLKSSARPCTTSVP